MLEEGCFCNVLKKMDNSHITKADGFDGVLASRSERQKLPGRNCFYTIPYSIRISDMTPST